MHFNLDRRLLVYVSITGLILILVGLMVLPVGIPFIEHVVSYWWADKGFQYAVGQEHKVIWYKKTAASFLFLFFVFFSAWVWTRLRGKKVAYLLLWAYFVFCASAIGSQFLAVGGWATHAQKNLEKTWDDAPGMIHVIDRIDDPRAFMADMTKYAGVDGQLKGPLALKAPAYVLLFYALDRINKRIMNVLGMESSNLAQRAALLAVAFTLLIGTYLIPFFHLSKILFNESVARAGLIVASLSPMVSYGFAQWMAWGHHFLIPISALCFLLTAAGMKREKWLWVAAGVVFSMLVGFVIWESFALSGLLLFIVFVHLYRTNKKAISKKIVLRLGLSVIGAFAMISLGLFAFLRFNIFSYLWDHLMVTHVIFSIHKMFVSRGPLILIASLFTNVFGFLFFMGVAPSVQLYHSLKADWRDRAGTKSLYSSLLVGLLIFVALLDLSGMSTETGRLWAFMLPAFLVASLSEFHRINDEQKIKVLSLVIFVLEGIQILVERSVFFSI